MNLLKDMTQDNLNSLLDQALTAGESDLAAMVKNEILRRNHSAHEETDPHPDAHGYFHYEWTDTHLTDEYSHPDRQRLWPPRKAQPVAPHDTAALIALLDEWQKEIGFPYQGKSLLEKTIEQLRWYAETRAAGEVGY